MKNGIIVIVLFAAVFIAGCSTTGYVVKARGINSIGHANASVTIVEYSDFECPFCGQAEPTIRQIEEKYPNDVRVIYKQFPLSQIHPYAQKAAEASECAADQGKFWEFVDMDYEHQDELNRDTLQTWAAALGLDTKLFARCTASHIKKAAILAEYKKGQDVGVSGTPTFFVNGKPVEADVASLSKEIDAALLSVHKAL